jgi:predicted AAA+ superfamily ATPase
MNNLHSNDKFIYRSRWIGPLIRSAIKTFPVVVITGARQVGKSTLLQNEFPDFKYISLDDFSTRQQAESDPASLWTEADQLIIDEAQKAPEIFGAIKLAVDRTRRKIRFLISGSSNLLLMKRISESLAGRAVYFEMFPMSYHEMYGPGRPPQNFFSLFDPNFMLKEQELKEIDPLPLALKGFMPPLINLSSKNNVLLWWEGYVRTYLERDLRDLSQIDSLVDFRRVLESLAIRTGNLLNQTEVSRDTRVSQPTVHRYLKLLEVSNLIQRVPAYHASKAKRIIKSPKIFFIDPALSIYLAGYHDEETLKRGREWGSFFEAALFMHLKILAGLLIPRGAVFYWRAITTKEVDFILEQGKRIVAFEAKYSKNPVFNDAKNLLAFLDENPQATRGVLLHAGKTIRWLHSKIIAVPWWWIGE